MRVLITGGLGYVGGRVAKFLSSCALSLRLTTRREGVAAPPWLVRGEIARLDLASDESLRAALDGITHVVHLAAMSEIDSARDPEGALVVNGLGALRLLRAAQQSGVERFVYLSTAHVYGEPLAGRLDEKTVPAPAHPYAITHKVAEDFILAAARKGGPRGVVLRLSNGLGAPMSADVNRWTLLANDLCRQAVTDRRLVLRSSGLQWRDFIALEDVGRAVRHVLELPSAALGDGLFNLGGRRPLRVIDLTELIRDRCSEVLGFAPPIVRPEPGEGETYEAVDYSVERLESTGFALEGSLDREIDATLQFCAEALRDGRL